MDDSKNTGTKENMTRRTFLDYVLSSTIIVWIISILYPVWEYLNPPKSPADNLSMVLAGTTDELTKNSGKIFKFGNKPGILIDTPGGDIRAFTAICTHLGCTVQYRQDLQHIWCACHDGHYDLHGINIKGPPPSPLAPYDVQIKGKNIYGMKKS
jgi:Rieske Fe-S protein